MESNPQTKKKLKLRERVLAHVVEHQERSFAVPIIITVLLIAILVGYSIWNRKSVTSYKVNTTAHSQSQDDETRITFTGDIVLGRNVKKRAEEVGYDRLFQKMQNVWKTSDCVMANLDTCVVDDVDAAEHTKSKDVLFYTDRSNLKYLKDAGIDVLSIATGHIADFGRSSVRNAVEELDALGIKHVGAGENREKAAEYTIVEVNNTDGSTVKVAIFGALGHQDEKFGAKAQRVANTEIDPNTPKTWEQILAEQNASDTAVSDTAASDQAEFDPWQETAGVFSGRNQLLAENINNVRAQVDAVIVYMHWGDDKMFYETEDMRELAHIYIDAGADLVIGTNPRVLLPVEVYESRVKTGLIFYSIGSLVYDDAETRVCDSISLDLVIDAAKNKRVEITPLRVNSAIPEETDGLYSKRIFASLTKRLDKDRYKCENNKLIISFDSN